MVLVLVLIFLIIQIYGGKIDMYESNKPTKERKQFYDFMERNKKAGSVGRKKVGQYVTKKGYRLYAAPAKSGGYWVDIKTKSGATIAETLARKKHITWWEVK